MKIRYWLFLLATLGLVIFIGCKKDDYDPSITISDIDGNVYHTVKIGTQIWMVENLKTTKFDDGTVIPLVEDSASWYALLTPGYSWYNNDEANYKETYGALYNFYTVNIGKQLCPKGWHAASYSDWLILIDYLGGMEVAGAKLKEAGFKALLGGSRSMASFRGDFYGAESFGTWWTSANTIYNPQCWQIFKTSIHAHPGNCELSDGFSVRCVKN